MKVKILRPFKGYPKVGQITWMGHGVALEYARRGYLEIMGGKKPAVTDSGEPRKRRGRPPGSKNKPKEEVIEENPQSSEMVAPSED